jgi:hypothetical protein
MFDLFRTEVRSDQPLDISPFMQRDRLRTNQKYKTGLFQIRGVRRNPRKFCQKKSAAQVFSGFYTYPTSFSRATSSPQVGHPKGTDNFFSCFTLEKKYIKVILLYTNEGSHEHHCCCRKN